MKNIYKLILWGITLLAFMGISFADSGFISDTGSKFLGINNTGTFIVNDPYVDIRYYGATTNDGVNDTQAIQNALDYCETNNCAVFIPKGNFSIDTLSMPQGVRLFGLGDSSLLYSMTASTSMFIAKYDASNFELDNFMIDRASQGTYAIDFKQGQNEDIIIKNLHIVDVSDRGIVVNGTGTIIENNFLDNVRNGLAVTKMYDEDRASNKYTRISHNYLINRNYANTNPNEYGEGIEINTHGEGTVTIDNNWIIGFGEDGIDANVINAIITNNYIEMEQNQAMFSKGITVGAANWERKSRMVVSNNIVSIGLNGTAIYASEGDVVSISNNYLYGNSSNSVGYENGIDVNRYMSKATLIGNIMSNLTSGILAGTDSGLTLIGNEYFGVNIEVDGDGMIEDGYPDIRIERSEFNVSIDNPSFNGNNLTYNSFEVCTEDNDACGTGFFTKSASQYYPTDTDGNLEFRWYGNSNINKTLYVVDGKVGIYNNPAPDYELDVAGDIGFNQYLYHNGDTDTLLWYTSDQIRFRAGGEYLLNLYEGSPSDYVQLGDGGTVDIRLNDRVNISGTTGTMKTNDINSTKHTICESGNNCFDMYVEAGNFIIGGN